VASRAPRVEAWGAGRRPGHGAAALCVCLTLAALPPQAAAAAVDPYPGVGRAYLVRVNGQTLWEHAADQAVAPASLTKMLTGLLVIEAGRADEVVTASPRAAQATGSRLGLRAGERYTVDTLLQATLLASGNDACRALAEWRDGTEAAFVARMNRRAAELGLRQTRFVNACGHDAEGHVSTAGDLATLAEAAMGEPRFAAIVRRTGASLATVDGSRRFQVTNRNALVGRLQGAVGVKSGFTPAAGKCVVAWAERGASRVLLVLLGAKDRWWDAHALVERAFDHVAAAR
jgi:D-alanyl-D-alanine carboxypeptidase (penicillin-binding protein 5/6)